MLEFLKMERAALLHAFIAANTMWIHTEEHYFQKPNVWQSLYIKHKNILLQASNNTMHGMIKCLSTFIFFIVSTAKSFKLYSDCSLTQ